MQTKSKPIPRVQFASYGAATISIPRPAYDALKRASLATTIAGKRCPTRRHHGESKYERVRAICKLIRMHDIDAADTYATACIAYLARPCIA